MKSSPFGSGSGSGIDPGSSWTGGDPDGPGGHRATPPRGEMHAGEWFLVCLGGAVGLLWALVSIHATFAWWITSSPAAWEEVLRVGLLWPVFAGLTAGRLLTDAGIPMSETFLFGGLVVASSVVPGMIGGLLLAWCARRAA